MTLLKISTLISLISFNLVSAMNITLVHGDGDTNKIDLVVIGDGYSAQEIKLYTQKVDEMVNYMFTSPKSKPYPRYKNFINVWRIDLVSPQSGVDDPNANIWKNTPLNGHKGCIDWTIQQCQVDWNITHDSIQVATSTKGFKADWFLVFLNMNDATAAAHHSSRGILPVLGTEVHNWHSRQLDIILHEGGHAWHKLADEYHYSEGNTFSGASPNEVNVSLDSMGDKWSHWLDYQAKDMSKVASFEGSKYAEFGIWDPTQGSKMDGGGPFDCHNMNNECGHHAIAVEKIILDIHAITPQILKAPSTGSTVKNGVKLYLSDSLVSKVDWILDGELQRTQGSEFISQNMEPGIYQLQAIIYDEILNHANSDNSTPHPLDLVRKGGNQLKDSLNWNLEVTAFTTAILPKKFIFNSGPLNNTYDIQGRKSPLSEWMIRIVK